MPRTKRKELRLTPELLERVDKARGDVSFNRFVEKALKVTLGIIQMPAGQVLSKVPIPDEGQHHKDAMARQAKLNAAKAKR